MAKTILEELLVKITGDASGLKRATKEAEGSMGTLSRATKVAGGVLAGFATIETVKMIAQVSKQTLDWADNMGDLAQTLGITTDYLQQMQYAAIGNGSSINEINAAMVRFSQSLGDAYKNGGPVAKTLQDIGVKALDANGNLLPIEAIFADVADAISMAETEQEKLSVAVDLFGRSSGPSMVRMLGEGNIKLEELRKKAIDAGAVMDSELIVKAGEINERWDLLSFTIGTKLKSALISAIDYFVELSDQSAEARNNLIGWGDILGLDQSKKELEAIEKEIDKTRLDFLNAMAEKGMIKLPPKPKRKPSGVGFIDPDKNTNTESALKELKKTALETEPAIDAINTQLFYQTELLAEIKNDAASTFSSFARSVAQGENALSALKTTALDVIGSIAESMMKAAFTGDFGSGIGAAIAGGLTNALGLTVTAQSGPSAGRPVIPKFSSGISRVPTDGLAMIHRGERIVPARDNGGSGVVVNQNINLSAGVAQTVQLEVTKMLPMLKREMLAGVVDARQRGMAGV